LLVVVLKIFASQSMFLLMSVIIMHIVHCFIECCRSL